MRVLAAEPPIAATSASRSCPARRPTTTSSAARSSGCRPRTRACTSTAVEDAPDGAPRRRRHPRHRRDRAPRRASSASTSTPPPCASRTARRSIGEADAIGKVKKQSGGHGQFADREPARRAAGPRRAASSSRTRSSAARSRATTSPPCRRASRRRWPTGGVHGFPVVDVLRRVLRRQVPLRRLERDGVQDRRGTGLQGGDGRRRRRRARADLAAAGHRPDAATRAT